MSKIKVIVFLILIFLTCFQSCRSTQGVNENVIYIMVYDFESKEINGVEIFADNKKIGETDIYGRFIFPMNEKINEIIFRKINYFSPKKHDYFCYVICKEEKHLIRIKNASYFICNFWHFLVL